MKSLSLLGSLALVLHFGACASSSDITGEGLNAPTDTAVAATQGAENSVAQTATDMAKDVAVDTAKRTATDAATNAVTNQAGGGAANAVKTGSRAVNTADALR
ncbi:MAG: hypothetical protein GWQ05_25140 [Verrucomicrobiaceae bacterium]|nr:hypothetical protein [Verrucomicrobiaceae bacterium]